MTSLTHEFTCKLPVSAARVFRALTDPTELAGWFAEHSLIEPHEGGAYRFWGRHTYGNPARGQADQQITRYEPDRALAYRWTLHDRASEVSFEIAADPEQEGAVIMAGRHHFDVPPAINRAREMVDDLWRLNCGNLQAHIAGNGGVLLPDYGDPQPQIRVSLLIDAPRARVFRALMDPALLNQWVASAADVDPRVGGRYSYGWSYETGGRKVEGGPSRIIELVQDEKLVTDWPDWRGDESVPRQKITWLLADEGRQTRLTLIHDDFSRAVDISDYPFGWGWFLSRLEATLKGDAPAVPAQDCG
jgi:uncharacterized protein YndB with AHSA1/START domain